MLDHEIFKSVMQVRDVASGQYVGCGGRWESCGIFPV